MVLSHSLSKIFLEISPPAKIGCLLDDKAREGPAQPAQPSHPPSYRPFDGKFSTPTCPTQCASCWPPATPIVQGREATGRSCKAERPEAHLAEPGIDRTSTRSCPPSTEAALSAKKMKTTMNTEK